MKKVLLLLLAVFCIAGNLQAQEPNMYDEMLNKSLEKYIDDCLKYNKGRASWRPGKINLSEWYINLEDFPMRFKFSQKIHDTGIGFIYVHGRNAYEVLQKEQPVICLVDLTLHGNKMTIKFKTADAQIKRDDNLYMAFSPDEGPFYCIWEYSCETEEWEFKESGWK